MKCSGHPLYTPVYLKTVEAMPWPREEPVFHLLTRDGLFLCRNHAFFTSCVPTEAWPSELASQKPFLQIRYPRLPRPLIERVVGFFDIIGERHASEAAVLLTWDRDAQAIVPIVPPQTGTVSTTYYGDSYPMDLEYEIPPLPPRLMLIGDMHSHVDGAAYASYTDKADELHRPGLHLVVGRIQEEPPQFHCEVVADGVRFRVRDLGLVLEGYRQRRRHEVPREWLAQVSVQPWRSAQYRSPVNGERQTGGDHYGSSGSWSRTPPVIDVTPADSPTPQALRASREASGESLPPSAPSRPEP